MKEFLYNSFVTNSATLTLQQVLLNFLAAIIISALIFIAYRVSHSGPVYSKRFNVSLVMLTLVTTLVMNVIGNNIALSLGMVGALSIVRFRTAIKDPRDTAYIFWTIAVGICCGVSDYLIAGIGSVVIFIFLILFGFIHNNERIMIIIKIRNKGIDDLLREMDSFFGGNAKLRVQNTSIPTDMTECIYEVSDKLLAESEKKTGNFVKHISGIVGLVSVDLVHQDDEITQ